MVDIGATQPRGALYVMRMGVLLRQHGLHEDKLSKSTRQAAMLMAENPLAMERYIKRQTETRQVELNHPMCVLRAYSATSGASEATKISVRTCARPPIAGIA